MPHQNYLQLLRESTSSALWSQAVAMARRNIFTITKSDEDHLEVILRLKDSGQGLNPEVKLFVEDEDWECDCVSKDDPCLHVIASAIMLKRNLDNNIPLPWAQTEETTQLFYEWSVDQDRLLLKRWLIKGDVNHSEAKKEPLQGSLLNFASGLANFLPSKLDLSIDKCMLDLKNTGNRHELRRRFLQEMANVEPSRFLGSLKKASPDRHGILTTYIPENRGVRIQVSMDPEIDKVYSNGFFSTDDTVILRADRETMYEFAKFSGQGYWCSEKEWPTFQAEWLGRLAKYTRVDVSQVKLVDMKHIAPTIRLYIEKIGSSTLRVTPRIFYGTPPIAIVIDDELRPLQNHTEEMPHRQRDAERTLRDMYWQTKKLTLNESKTYSSLKEFEALSRLLTSNKDFWGEDPSDFVIAGEISSQPSVTFEDGKPLFSLNAKNKPIALLDVFSAFERGEDFMKVEGLGLFKIPTSWLERHRHLIAEVKDLTCGETSSHKIKNLVLESLCKELAVDFTSCEWSDLTSWQDDLKDVNINLSSPHYTLRPYQKEGVQWLLRLRNQGFGALLADDMGLGKTLQALLTLQGHQDLIICPKSLISNWEREIRKFRPELNICIYHGSQRNLPESTKGIIITTYGTLRADTDKLSQITWHTIIADESQAFKNPESQTFQALERLSSQFRIALSGTPIENSTQDLWAQMHFINPGLLGSLRSFRQTYSEKSLENHNERSAYLRKKITPFILRRMKEHVALDLPPKTETQRLLTMSMEEEERYLTLLHQARSEVAQNSKQGMADILKVLLKLRQVCCHPGLLQEQDITARSSKIDYLTDSLQKIIRAGHKALVISQWTSLLDIVENRLKSLEWQPLRIDGKTQDRLSVVDRFQIEGSSPIMLLSLKAGGVGLNLTAADYVFSLDPWWNPAAESQAHDRAYRIGQDKPVFIERLIMKDTLEEKIIALQERKKRLSVDLVESLGESSLEITRDDLLDLLSL